MDLLSYLSKKHDYWRSIRQFIFFYMACLDLIYSFIIKELFIFYTWWYISFQHCIKKFINEPYSQQNNNSFCLDSFFSGIHIWIVQFLIYQISVFIVSFAIVCRIFFPSWLKLRMYKSKKRMKRTTKRYRRKIMIPLGLVLRSS